MNFRQLLFLLILPLAAPYPAWASSQPDCASGTISVHCGSTPSAIWHEQRLWVVFAQEQHLYLVSSRDEGKTYSTPIQVNARPEIIETNGENRPKIAVTDKAVLVSWTRKTEGNFTGDIRLARSTDGGKTFTAPRTINNDGLLTSHRFDSLQANPDGTVYIVWLDKRDKVEAERQGHEYIGSALYYAVSTDHGKSFSDNFKVADNSCECCRLATAPAAGNRLAVFWRHLYGEQHNIRDHGLAVVTPSGSTSLLERATVDHWRINACPHHGPDISPSSHGGYHLAWFTAGEKQQGILYGFYDATEKLTRHITTMDASPGASHPQVIEHQGKVFYVWKLFDGERTQIRLSESNDGGKSWSQSRALAVTQGASDHPLLIKSRDAVYLTWHTQAEGFRLVEIASGDVKHAE